MSGIRVDARLSAPGFTLSTRFELDDGLGVLFGRSGAGKSLTLRAIAGLLAPADGRIEIGGKAVYDAAARVDVRPQERRVGFVSQDLALFPHLSVRGNVEFGLGLLPRRHRRERADELLACLGLEALAHRTVPTLSGGQRQRVALARALAPRPRALLLDEPFSALDGPAREEMRELVRDVRREFRIPVVLVTHDLYEAYTLADLLVVYGDGAVQSGPPCELFKAPATPEIARLLTSERLYLCG